MRRATRVWWRGWCLYSPWLDSSIWLELSLVREKFIEMITERVLLLSVSEDLEATKLWTFASHRWVDNYLSHWYWPQKFSAVGIANIALITIWTHIAIHYNTDPIILKIFKSQNRQKMVQCSAVLSVGFLPKSNLRLILGSHNLTYLTKIAA